MGATVLLVTGSAHASEGALCAAVWIARARGCSVRWATILDGDGRRRQSPTLPSSPSSTGSVAGAVSARATECKADLIILGTGPGRDHPPILDADTVLAVAAHSTVPVWIVPPHYAAPPHHILLGTDFSRASMRVGRIALGIAGPDAQLDVAHVAPDGSHSAAGQCGGSMVPEHAMLLDALDSALGPLSQVRFGRALLQGEPASALLACAVTGQSDVLAVGSHGRYGRAPTEPLGRVARQIVCAVASGRMGCSVLLSGAMTGGDGER